ncbi:hypothetical protein [Pseudomonas syringae]|uniref:Phage tail protein n=1 Tax=Pseudomonas syringae pv. syringae TaxID=321 RepID=A0AB35JI92_PSESY|nr:hypothetical protein [Pseudomonas syringae]MBI6720972.1 hypothetical protein [Pseudomonas syringae]MBI6742305.1 hypothetical protein [Pseudomonas syringae]MBI6747322.1 hypothetical protein [Pseudomonas syringae]MBI6750065.1 hypothetical protein [Pseudomonas syringae]MBI6755315.1 hypothetical protein [Pseudomonas syringae]
MTDTVIEEFLPPVFAAPEEPAAIGMTFSDVALKTDGSFVITVAGNRCHVTEDYNPSLYQAVRDYLEQGGSSSDYAEDIVVQSDPALLARLWIEASLKTSETLVSEYRDARDLGAALPITAEQFSELLTWRQAVREWPQVAGYPIEASRPDVPAWIQTVLTNGQ